MYHDSELLEMRIDRFTRQSLTPAIERATAPVTITAWEAPGEPVGFTDVPFDDFKPFEVGQPWGRAWGTVWFKVAGTVPAQWSAADGQPELIVDLGFTPAKVGFQAEGLVWSVNGTIIKAIEPRHGYVKIDSAPGESFELYIEAASNPDLGAQFVDFVPTDLGRLSTAPAGPLYALRRIELVQRDPHVWELVQDVWTLRGLVDQLSVDSPRRAAVLAALDRVVDLVDPTEVNATATVARDALAAVLASPAAASAHRIFAVGHAHIDSAWLWPVRETIRKCARSFSNVLELMEEDSQFVFACSSAQQFAWMKQYYPELFERIKARVAEGRFVPVGGMWVESDTNMPGSEALARQFVHGKGFFLREFGVEPKEVWLPDSFGYTGSLPQIARAAGAEYFLTQKLSWNETNTFPHHSFEWEGIDGSRIFTHFPPVDTYNSLISGEELARAERNFSDKDRANTSLVPFGFGDGGGGPTREMIAAAHRTESLEGSPTVRLSSPREFFEEARRELVTPAVWVGELYLEFHRGTYASQARTKRGNRRSEHLLHEAELWASTAAVRAGAAYPYEALDNAWKTVLLQQFHDILPGSSIGWVHDQAVENYAVVAASLESVIADATAAVTAPAAPTVPRAEQTPATERAELPELTFNASPFAIDGVPAFGVGIAVSPTGVTLVETEDQFVLANGVLSVVVDNDGTLSSIVEVASGREVVPAGARANQLQIFRDTPTQWDAWDVDVEYRRSSADLRDVDSLEVIENTAERVRIRSVRSVSHSRITQVITLNGGSNAIDIETTVDWHERQRMLKLAFAVDVHTSAATSEIQFGHIIRPTHTNTSWDTARFETPAHRWVHVSDSSFGVGIANDSTYGHDITRHRNENGATYSLVRQTLLKSPLFPDPEADQGEHVLRSSIVVGPIADAIENGYRLNLALRRATPSGDVQAVTPLVTSSNPAVVIETVKLAEDRSGDVIVRLYESRGGQAQATLEVAFAVDSIVETDLLEREVPALAVIASEAGPADGGHRVSLGVRPFQIVTLRLARPLVAQ